MHEKDLKGGVTGGARRLLEMISSSRQIYKGMVELLRVRWTAAVQDARGCVAADTDLLTSLRRHLLLSLKRRRVEQVDRCRCLPLHCSPVPLLPRVRQARLSPVIYS